MAHSQMLLRGQSGLCLQYYLNLMHFSMSQQPSIKHAHNHTFCDKHTKCHWKLDWRNLLTVLLG